jgi:histidine triad (HIT) family protein
VRLAIRSCAYDARMSVDCLFCRIVAGDIPATVVHETPTTLAFRDINPQAPSHVVVIPRDHHSNVGELVAADPALAAAVLATVAEVAAKEGAEGGYRVVFNTGLGAGQTVDHVHAHVLSGRDLTWPPG